MRVHVHQMALITSERALPEQVPDAPGHRRLPSPAGEPRPTAAPPMENRYCSCELTRPPRPRQFYGGGLQSDLSLHSGTRPLPPGFAWPRPLWPVRSPVARAANMDCHPT